MNLNQVQLVLNNLRRALLAEEKQGYMNTGVLGGFSAFLEGIIPRLKQLFPGYDLELLKKVSHNYAAWSPVRRRESFAELKRFLQEIAEEARKSAEVSSNSGIQPV